MDNVAIRTGMIVQMDGGDRWRIVHIASMTCRLVRLDCSKRQFLDQTVSTLADLIAERRVELVEDEPVHVDLDSLSDAKKDVYQEKVSFIHEFARLFGPDYSAFLTKGCKPEYVALYTSHGISQATADRLILRWLQSGCQDEVLADRANVQHKPYKYTTKTGRKSEEPQGVVLDDKALEAFEDGLKEYRSGRRVTISDAFVRLLLKHYSVCEEGSVKLLPEDQHPTERQFRYYIAKNMSREELEIVKTSAREYRNNSRLLLGGPVNPTLRPGMILEADALEIDLNIVSEFDTEQNISRPIVYVLIDLYSHCIVAFHVGFENNSILGLTSVMMNLFDDKNTFLAGNGGHLDCSGWWPSSFIPQEIRCDRGSDFASDEFSRICAELNIRRTLEPGAMGSMKGLVEESFRLFHQGIGADFEHLGLMQKRYDSRHKKEAALTLEDVRLLLVDFVKFHNTFYTKIRRLTRDMVKQGVEKTPISFWNYGVGKYGAPSPVTHLNRSKLLFSLMLEGRASISRAGVTFRGLVYDTFSNDPKLRLRMKGATTNANRSDKSGNRRNSMAIRYDLRSINNLYYVEDGVMKMLTLSPSKCGGLKDLTWGEYDEYQKAVKKKDRQGASDNLQNKVERKMVNDLIAAKAQRKTYANANDISEARKMEKHNTNFDDRMEKRIVQKQPELDEPAPEEEAPEEQAPKPVTSASANNEDDLMKLMYGGEDW